MMQFALSRRRDVYCILDQYDNALADHWRLRGRVYCMLGQDDIALNDFDKALEIEPDNAFALSRRREVFNVLNQ